MLTSFLIYFQKGHGFFEVWKPPSPTLNFVVPACCFAFSLHHQNFTPPIPTTYQFISTLQAGYTMAQLSLLFYSHLNAIKLTLVCCDFLSFYNALLEKYVNEHSSCNSSETQHLLKCSKKILVYNRRKQKQTARLILLKEEQTI